MSSVALFVNRESSLSHHYYLSIFLVNIRKLTLPLFEVSFAVSDMVLPRFLNTGVLCPMVLSTCWAVLHIMQYGFAITSLNGIQQSVTCQKAENHTGILQIPIATPVDCIPMTVGPLIMEV